MSMYFRMCILVHLLVRSAAAFHAHFTEQTYTHTASTQTADYFLYLPLPLSNTALFPHTHTRGHTHTHLAAIWNMQETEKDPPIR